MKDAGGKPLAGRLVTLAQDGAGHSVISPASGPSDGNGHVTFTVDRLTVEQVTYTATDTTDSVVFNPTAIASFVIDTTAPKVSLSSPTAAVSLSTAIPLRWSATDNAGGVGVGHYDVQYKVAPWNSGFRAWTNWMLNTTATSATFTGGPGTALLAGPGRGPRRQHLGLVAAVHVDPVDGPELVVLVGLGDEHQLGLLRRPRP